MLNKPIHFISAKVEVNSLTSATFAIHPMTYKHFAVMIISLISEIHSYPMGDSTTGLPQIINTSATGFRSGLCVWGHNYSASESLFFSNCQGENGEACACVFYRTRLTVTRHKSTLLISGMFFIHKYQLRSFPNQSNHMYKLTLYAIQEHWNVVWTLANCCISLARPV